MELCKKKLRPIRGDRPRQGPPPEELLDARKDATRKRASTGGLPSCTPVNSRGRSSQWSSVHDSSGAPTKPSVCPAPVVPHIRGTHDIASSRRTGCSRVLLPSACPSFDSENERRKSTHVPARHRRCGPCATKRCGDPLAESVLRCFNVTR